MKKLTVYSFSALLLLGLFLATPVLAEETITTDTQSEESTVVDNNDLSTNNIVEESLSDTNLSLSTTEPACTNIMPTGTVDFANATLVVPEGACPIMVSFSSYTFASTIVPYDQQVLVDNITDTYGPGTYHIGPLQLECNWQTDLYVGPVQEHLLAIGGHDQTNGPVLGYNYMENQTCGTPAAVTVDVKANGSDGPVTINSGDAYTYTWNSTNATSCLETSPINSGISLAGDSGPISSGVFYPATSSPVTISVTCTNGTSTSSDSVIINLAAGTTTPGIVTVDVKANGSDGPVVINNGESYVFTWTSSNATSCLQTSPINSGISLSGNSGNIGPTHSFYPTASSSVTLTMTCTNGTSSSTDSVIVSLAPTPSGCSVLMPTGTVNFAMATLVVPEGACPIKVSFSSYTFASTIVPYDKQILVDNITATYGPGTYSIGPLKLECNWQTDLYVGDVQEHLLAVGGHDQSKGPVLGYNYMENQICGPANVVVTKIVINDNGGTKQVSDFPLFVGTTTVASGATTTLAVGSYKVSETYDSSLYAQTFSGDCDANGNITLAASTTRTCIITNNDISQSSNDDDNDGGSSRRRHRGGGIVLGLNAEPQPEVLGVTFEPTIPGLPNTGTGPLDSAGSISQDIALVLLGLLTLIALNVASVVYIKRRIL